MQGLEFYPTLAEEGFVSSQPIQELFFWEPSSTSSLGGRNTRNLRLDTVGAFPVD